MATLGIYSSMPMYVILSIVLYFHTHLGKKAYVYRIGWTPLAVNDPKLAPFQPVCSPFQSVVAPDHLTCLYVNSADTAQSNLMGL